MQYITFANATTTSGATVAIDTVNLSGLQVGDLMIGELSISGNTSWNAMPSGWASFGTVNNSNPGESTIVWKFADSTDVSGTTHTFTNSASGTAVKRITLMVIRGDFNVSQFTAGTFSNVGNTSASTSANGTTITPRTADCMICYFIYIGNNSATVSNVSLATSSPAFTQRYLVTTGGTRSSYCATAIRPELTATGTASATLSASTTSNVHIVSISPKQIINLSDTQATTESQRAFTPDTNITDTLITTDISDIEESGDQWTFENKPSSTWILESK
jgi:hypothetical protein